MRTPIGELQDMLDGLSGRFNPFADMGTNRAQRRANKKGTPIRKSASSRKIAR